MNIQLVRLADERSSDVLYFPKVESLALGYAAACLRAKSFKAKIVDEEVSCFPRKETLGRLLDADLAGFTAIAKPQIFPIIDTIRELKADGCNAHFSIGGQYATFLYNELLSLKGIFDSVVRFEGELTFLELAEAVENKRSLSGIKGLAFKEKGKIRENALRPLIDDLDSLPFPARDTLPEILSGGGLPALSSSRGCYNNCSYCSISCFYSIPKGKKFRLRSAGNVLSELQELKDLFPSISEIWFVDDNFALPGSGGWKRTVELCGGIKELGLDFDIYLRASDISKRLLALLKGSGLRNVFIGAEAADNFTLQKIFNKNVSAEQTLKAIRLCNRMRISVDPGFIMFHPWSTMETIEKNIKFLEETGQYTLYGIVSYLTPYTFTLIGQRMLSKELPYKKPRFRPSQQLNDFVPYEIADEKAELLLCLALDSFEEFKALPTRLSLLSREIRKLKLEGGKKSALQLEKKWVAGAKEMNKAGMLFFKELFFFLKQAELSESEIRPFFEGFKERVKAYVSEALESLEDLSMK